MSKYTEAEFFQRSEWEGGTLVAIFDYGIEAEDIEPGRVRELVADIQQVRDTYEELEALYEEWEEHRGDEEGEDA